MAMPLANKNLTLCVECSDCLNDKECRFSGKKFKFEVPAYVRTKLNPKVRERRPPGHKYPIEQIRLRIESGERATDIAKEYGLSIMGFGSVLYRSGIKRPQEIKFTNDERRASSRARRIDVAGLKGKCGECGRTGKLERHHPDYSQCYLVEYICRLCHVRKHKGTRREYKPLSREATAIRLNMILNKYGAQVASLFVHFYSFPPLTATELGRKVGISRERVRQFLYQLHGTYRRKHLVLDLNPATFFEVE